jgi:hypothetical protein
MQAVPNVREVDLSYSKALHIDPSTGMFPCIIKLTWKGANRGGDMRNQSISLTGMLQEFCYIDELCIDNYVFHCHPDVLVRYSNGSNSNYYSWMYYYRRLERISMKDVSCWCCGARGDVKEPMPQEAIIKMVRHTTTLHWLRSDLTKENVAMLQNKQPEVTFVSD